MVEGKDKRLCIQEYNLYLEKVEDMIHSLAEGLDSEKTGGISTNTYMGTPM